MAKQVSELFIKLGIQGEQELSKLKSSFRDLEKVTGLSEQSISNVRTKLLQFAQQAGNSESVANALVSAFKGLRAQTEYCSTAYTELTDDINRFTGVLRGSTDAVERQRQSLLSNAAASRQNAKALQEQVTALERLRDQTRPGSSAFLQLNKDIEAARANLGRFKSEAAAFSNTLNQMPGASLDTISAQLARLQQGMRTLRIVSNEYLAAQQRINLVTAVQSRLTGRQQVRATAQMYASAQYTGFVEGRAANLPLPNTQAGIQQRIGEIQAELPNVDISNYIRRRDLTRELVELNRQLRNTVVEVRTAEDFAAMAVRQHVSAARELLGVSGFAEFSQQARLTTPAGAVERSIERKRRRLAQQGQLLPSDQQNIQELTTTYVAALQEREQVAKSSYQRLLEYRERLNQREIELEDKKHAALLAAQKAADDAALASFDRRLARTDVLATRTAVLKNMLGFGGRDLSEFYQGVVGIGTQRQAAAQQLMGRSPQQALGDIFGIFSGSLSRTGEGTLDAAQALQQRAIEYSGRSRAVQQAFAAYAPGQAPAGMYPRTGESAQAYVRRVETSLEQGLSTPLAKFRNLIDVFGEKLGRAGDGYLQSERDLRRAAIKFSGNAPAVIEAFRNVGLGRTPTSMLPGAGESPAEYTARLGVGVSGQQLQLPALPQFAKGTTRELQTLRQSLQELRLDLDPLAANFEATERRITKSVKRIDRELGRREGGGGLSGMQFAQAAGAVVSGGIFGGPEGFLGGLIGSAFGGVGGAFAGAAIGGQASVIRQQLAAVADYNAQLNLAKTTLGQVSLSQDDYNRRLDLARQISKDYTLGLRETITGYAQVAAAASANNLTFKETETIYRGVVAAAVAFGKSQADIDAIVTATTQVLSKGKISAEELQGQIGERLPGAVARFAEATNRSLPQLAKDLQDGKVNIKDFVDYTRSQVTDYDALAKMIGSSPEKAGARLKLALDRAAETYGGFLQRVGASLQDLLTTIVNWFNDNETAIKRWIYLIYVAGKAVYDFGASVKSVADGVTTYVTRIASVVLPVVSQLITAADAYAKITGKPVQLGAGVQFNKATAGYAEFWKGMEFKPPQFGGGTPGVTAAPLGETPEQKRLREQRERDAQVAAEQAQRRNEEIAKQQIRLADNVFKYQMELEERRYQRRKELADLDAQNEIRLLFGTERERASARLRARQAEQDYDRRIAEADNAIRQARQQLTSAQQMAAVTASAAAVSPQARGLPAGVAGYITGDPRSPYYRADHGGSNYHEHLAFVSRAAAEAAYAKLRAAGLQVTEFKGYGRVGRHTPGSAHYAGLAMDIPAAQVPVGQERALTARVQQILGFGAASAGRQRAAVAAQQNRNITDLGDIQAATADLSAREQEAADLRQNKAAYMLRVNKTLTLDFTESIRQQNNELEKELRLNKDRIALQMEGHTESYIELQLKLNEIGREQNRLLAERLTATGSEVDSINQTIEAYRTQAILLRDIYDLQERTKQGFGFREGAKQYVESLGSMKEATSQLTLNGIKGLEDALMDLATTGSANFASFAAEVLKQGARMILQQLVLKPLIQGLANLFNPGAAAASASGFNLNLMESYASGGFAKGAAFAANGIIPYAMGGIVNTPTLFRFANGGVPSTGLMGEAGPEAIIPLRRGSDGKLGVAGGGSTSITINVDAKGSSAEGDPGRAAALGRVITAAVQAELVKQKRPGGLLSR